MQSARYAYCGAVRIDAKHTFFMCDRWAVLQERLRAKFGIITPNTMLMSEEAWEEISTFVEKIIRQKKKEEILVEQTP